MTRVKMCGLRSEADVRAVLELRPDFAGFILSGGFRRSISRETFAELSAMLIGSGVKRVGVFVNEPLDSIIGFADYIDVIQLHGSEDEDYIRSLRKFTDKPIIKAFTVRSEADIEAARSSFADYVLLDSGTGTGSTFDHSLIADIDRPFFLAGGLTAENVGEAIRRYEPFAVDASSSLETEGIKDKTKMAAFAEAARRKEN
ncbi:MAG: phosphoribosylanthranilate isomerase [Ruminococcus sp.]|nr:phosphoribosylanthranilate isomerase [Ruminococcus sp.]